MLGALATEAGVELRLTEAVAQPEALAGPSLSRKILGIYTLTEAAGRQAEAMLRAGILGLVVDLNHDHGGSAALAFAQIANVCQGCTGGDLCAGQLGAANGQLGAAKEKRVLGDLPLNEPTYVRVKRAIVRDLFAGEFRPGSQLTIDRLTSKYGVSHMPVREALRQLQGEGVLESHAHKGFRVAAISERYIRNVYDIRIGIETLLARRAVENGTDTEFERVYEIHSMFVRELKSGDVEIAKKINVRFHDALYEIAQNPEARQVLDGRTLVVSTFGSSLGGYRDADRSIVMLEHQRIVDAMACGDPSACAQALFDHVTHARERLVERMYEKHLLERDENTELQTESGLEV